MIDKDTLINKLIQFELIVLDQRNRIVQMRYQIDSGSVEDAIPAAREFGKANEEIYLRLKSLIYTMQGKRAANMAEEIGTTESFPSSLMEIRPGIWKFTLPPFFSVSAKKKLYNEGKHMYYLVLNLQMQYEKNSGRIETLKRPLVLFRHHICTDVQLPFDYDNIDSKRAIDAMQGYFIGDDNALSLTAVHEAVEDPERSYCEIYVLDMAKNGGYLNAEIARKLN